MEFISDIFSNRDMINGMISKYGHSSGHNLYYYMYSADHPFVSCFVKMGEYGIMAHVDRKNKEWSVFSILAPKEKELGLLMQFINHVFGEGAKKVWVEVDADFRKMMLKEFKDSPYRSSKVRFVFETPIFNMKTWDGDLMPGKDWKDMRYYWSKFFKDHKVEFKNLKDPQHPEKPFDLAGVSADDMKALVNDWKKQRMTGDKAHIERYIAMIDNGFEGYDSVRIMIVDGKVASITAGYKIANSNDYYSAVGIYAREFDRIGEVSNIDDLRFLKLQGYSNVDFGNGDKKLNDFKKKFRPEYLYKTLVFSIVRKDNAGDNADNDAATAGTD